MYPYDIEQLAEKAGVSKTSIYNLISKNKSFVKDNSTKRQRKVYYNQAVLDWLLEYYNQPAEPQAVAPVDDQQPEEAPQEAAEQPTNEPVGSKPAEDKDAVIEALRAQISTLEAQVVDLKEQLARESAHCTELIRQNSVAWMTINREKEEKIKLLPAPKKPVSVAIHDFFAQLLHGKQEEASAVDPSTLHVVSDQEDQANENSAE